MIEPQDIHQLNAALMKCFFGPIVTLGAVHIFRSLQGEMGLSMHFAQTIRRASEKFWFSSGSARGDAAWPSNKGGPDAAWPQGSSETDVSSSGGAAAIKLDFSTDRSVSNESAKLKDLYATVAQERQDAIDAKRAEFDLAN